MMINNPLPFQVLVQLIYQIPVEQMTYQQVFSLGLHHLEAIAMLMSIHQHPRFHQMI